MYSECVALLGIEPEKVWGMAYSDLTLMLAGYWYKDMRQWEHTRAIMGAVINVHAKKGKALKPHEIIRLPIDSPASTIDTTARTLAANAVVAGRKNINLWRKK